MLQRESLFIQVTLLIDWILKPLLSCIFDKQTSNLRNQKYVCHLYINSSMDTNYICAGHRHRTRVTCTGGENANHYTNDTLVRHIHSDTSLRVVIFYNCTANEWHTNWMSDSLISFTSYNWKSHTSYSEPWITFAWFNELTSITMVTAFPGLVWALCQCELRQSGLMCKGC